MYVTVGLKDGWCEHEHENRTEAEKCLLEHQKTCRKKNKISDRIVTEVDSVEELMDALDRY